MQTVPDIAPGELPEVPENQLEDLDAIHADPRNPQDHGPESVEAVAASLAEFGQQKPVVIDADGVLIAGHGTVTAARALGWRRIWAVRSDLEGTDRSGYQVADNATAQHAAWNDKLAEIVHEIHEQAPEKVSALGLAPERLEELLLDADGTNANDGEGVPDPEPPPDKPRSQLGDLWFLGEHRVLCGDSTKIEDMHRATSGAHLDLCMTDPPYGADIAYDTHDDTQEALGGLIGAFMPMVRAACDVVALTPGVNNVFAYPKPDAILCWFYGAGTGMGPWGFTAWQPFIVWGADPKLAHGEGCHPDGFQFMMTRDDAEENRSIMHACPKPFSVWLRFMERLSHAKTETVYDPFMGSGTTLLAADRMGYRCSGVEMSPAYVDVIVRRWQEATGGIATLDGPDGIPFDELTGTRKPRKAK